MEWGFVEMSLPEHAMFAPSHRIHFIGIGGIGMSGIAEILLTMGYAVSGSDLRASAVTDRLQKLGATIYVGHRAENARACDVVVTSSAVARDNPEVMEARARKTPVIPRAEMLAELMRLKYGIAVAGMHGKTTTTSMIAAVLAGGGLDPTVVVGGRVDAMGSNARLGRSQYLVAEADESDRSFLKLSPVLAVVTNLDREHMEAYRDMEDVENAFVEFIDKLPFYGAVTACADDARLKGILPRVTRKVYTYGVSEGVDFRLVVREADPSAQPGVVGGPPTSLREVGHAEPSPAHATFEVSAQGLLLGPFDLNVPGRHNLLNATAAVAIGVQLGIAPKAIAEALRAFGGVDRRFQIKGKARGVTVVDDYGHHPTEIRATLQAARECGYKRVLVLFQPHRYTRTQDLMDDFAGAFGDADAVEVLDIYAASEQPIQGVTGDALARRIPNAKYAASVDEGVGRLVSQADEGDLIMTLGAGSVSQAGPVVLERLGGEVVSG
jgi:UDP-N-acetylmuramate--alanine ligase